MENEENDLENLFGRYKIVIASIIFLSLFIIWNKPKSREDCLSFTNKNLAKACLSEIIIKDYRIKPSPFPVKAFEVSIVKLELNSAKLEPIDVTQRKPEYNLTGVLKNNSGFPVKNVQIQVYFYNYGDDSEKSPPVDKTDIVVKDTIGSGDSLKIKEAATSSETKIDRQSFSWHWKIIGAQD